ncbi:MAG: hydantoinase B/oxoprolinase family protein [Hyphomicrobiaceae bacterium]
MNTSDMPSSPDHATLDPITLEIVWNGLRSINDETWITIQKSAFSTNIKERHDHSTAIADAFGQLVAQAEWSLPIHLASMLGLMQILIERYGDDIHEGDIFIANDPHVAGGTHLPDLALVSPVFVDGNLVSFVANLAHHADVGGAAQGSMSGGMSEIWQEGLRVPVMRLYSRGRLNRELMDILLLNMRLPDERRGDLNAQIAACHLGVERMQALFARYGTNTVTAAFAEILQRTDRRMKAAIAQIPDGSYTFEDVLDDDGLEARDILFKLEVRKNGERIVFDFTGSSRQVPGNVNLTLNAVQSAVCYGLKALLDPELPNNQAAIDAIDIVAPLGSIANCVSPGAVALRANTCQRVVDVVIGALADVLPEQAIGAANGANTSIVFAGVDPATNIPYVYLETLGGGMGGRSDRDGKDGVQVHITNTSNLPIEAIEMEYPLRVDSYGFVENSGGAGTYRGGLGLRRVVRPIGHTCEMNGVGERFRHQPWGIFGGAPGASGRFRMREADGAIDELPPKTGRRRLRPEQAVIVETPGAGGYGKPAERVPEDVARDRQSEKFSIDFLGKHYPQSSSD